MTTQPLLAPRGAPRRTPGQRASERKRRKHAPQKKAPPLTVANPHHLRVQACWALAIAVCGLWSYWPTLASLASTWSRVSDYAHGFLVIPLAAYFLWVRRGRYPGLGASSPILACALLVLSVSLRHAGDVLYFTFLDGWSLIPWLAASCALLGGRPLLSWSWPSLLFLFFMVPLPFALENDLSGPLQRIATELSTQGLQFLGQPGFAEGNVIVLGQERLEVAQACSGLRLFLGVIALSYAFVVIIDRPLWEKIALVASAAPIAVVSNAARIIVTGLLCQQFQPGPAARSWIHDGAGFGMILFAAGLFWLLLRYLRLLVREERVLDMSDAIRLGRA
jgi:exosortase